MLRPAIKVLLTVFAAFIAPAALPGEAGAAEHCPPTPVILHECCTGHGSSSAENSHDHGADHAAGAEGHSVGLRGGTAGDAGLPAVSAPSGGADEGYVLAPVDCYCEAPPGPDPHRGVPSTPTAEIRTSRDLRSLPIALAPAAPLELARADWAISEIAGPKVFSPPTLYLRHASLRL